MKYFRGALIFTLLVLAALYAVTGSLFFIYQAVVLSFVEISMSFDNAVVNAKKLAVMNAFWKKMFLTLGMLVAVLGMRFYLPIQIVASIAHLSLMDAYHLATHDQKAFAATLSQSHNAVAGFGGAFLLMTALKYFLDEEKETHWIGIIESPLAKLAVLEGLELLLTLGGILIVYSISHDVGFVIAAMFGLATFIAVDLVKYVLEQYDERLADTGSKLLAGGIGTFVYLEVLDASFSFDGVIASFALANNIFVVAAGLGIGAMFVRSMTIMLDDKGTLAELHYLENGAFWSIGMLSLFMYVGLFVHIPEWLVALTSIGLILASGTHSWLENQRESVAQLDKEELDANA